MKKDTSEDIEIIDQEIEWGDKGLSIKQLVLKHIDRISKYIFSGEQQPTTKESKSGGLTTTTDRRIVICQAIEYLTALLQPFYDKTMREKQNKLNESINKIEENLITSAINTTAFRKAKKNKENYKIWQDFLRKNLIITIDKESSYFEYYLTTKYALYMKLFQEQNKLLQRRNYLTSEAYTEEE